MASSQKVEILFAQTCFSNFLSEKNLLDKGVKFRTRVFPDNFIDQDKPESMYKFAGMDAKSIEEKVLNLLNSNIVLQKQK